MRDTFAEDGLGMELPPQGLPHQKGKICLQYSVISSYSKAPESLHFPRGFSTFRSGGMCFHMLESKVLHDQKPSKHSAVAFAENFWKRRTLG